MARFLIVEARFYSHLNDMLIAGARDELEEKGHEVEVVTVPGALEIPAAIALAAESLDSGAAQAKLGALVKASQRVGEAIDG